MRMLTLSCLPTVSVLFAVTILADDKSDNLATVRRVIANQNTAYAEAVTKQDLSAYMALFTDDATIMQVGKTFKGKKEIEVAAKEQLAAVKDPVVKTTELDVRGELAYEVGEYTVTARDGGWKTSGRYLVVWKQQKNGAWLIHVEATLPGGSRSADSPEHGTTK